MNKRSAGQLPQRGGLDRAVWRERYVQINVRVGRSYRFVMGFVRFDSPLKSTRPLVVLSCVRDKWRMAVVDYGFSLRSTSRLSSALRWVSRLTWP